MLENIQNIIRTQGVFSVLVVVVVAVVAAAVQYGSAARMKDKGVTTVFLALLCQNFCTYL